MIRPGQTVLLPFPQTDQTTGKLRPALVLRRLPGPYDDWLICLISSQLRHEVPGIDEVMGAIGNLTAQRLALICTRLANWILGNSS